MTEVEAPRVARVEPSHHLGQRPVPGPEHEVHVVGKKRPREAGSPAPDQLLPEALEEVLAIDVTQEDAPP